MITRLNYFFHIIVIVFLLVSCAPARTQSNPSVESPAASAFLLNVDVFPEGWVLSPSSPSDETEIYGTRDFGNPNVAGHSFQDIFRRPNDWSASDKYKVYLEGEFNTSTEHQPSVPYTPPPEITFRSKIADEYYFACGVEMIASCKMIARYHNYFVFFFFDLDTKEQPGGLTYGEIEHVLEAFEAKVTVLFKITSEVTPIK